MAAFIRKTALLFATGLAICSGAVGNPWASGVESFNMLGPAPHDSAQAVLGKPATLILETGFPPTLPGTYHCSMVYGAYKTEPDGNKLVTTILEGGHITVYFDPPIYDDPDNWYGLDFIVFGNSRFTGLSYVQENTNMESYMIKNGIERAQEPMSVSVSQDGLNWFDYEGGPYADDFVPTQSWAWAWSSHDWSPAELDFTRPVDPALTPADFGGKSAAEAIDLYKGSAGGTAFDIGRFDLPEDPSSGLKWIRYVNVTANVLDEFDFINEGEIDAFARVGRRIDPVSAGRARLEPDGARVIIKDAVVTAGTFETGPFCYIRSDNGCGGIRLLGRVLPRGRKVTVYGDMDTVAGGERVVRVTAIEDSGESAETRPVGMPNKSVGAASGPDTTGMLARVWGRVVSGNATDKSFVINDGSGAGVRCVAPRDPATGTGPRATFDPPADGAYVAVTGVISVEDDGGGSLTSVLRLRDFNDVQELLGPAN